MEGGFIALDCSYCSYLMAVHQITTESFNSVLQTKINRIKNLGAMDICTTCADLSSSCRDISPEK